MLRSLVYLLIVLCLSFSVRAGENTFDHSWVKDLNVQVEKLANTYQIEAKAIVQDAISSASQQKHCRVAKDLAHQAENIVRENLELSESEHSVRYPHLLVFVSFSMPLEVLKTLAIQVNQVGGKVVLRGLVNGSFKNTAEKVKELQQEVIIDPTLFESYQVKVVPTFILQNKATKKDEETDSGKSNSSPVPSRRGDEDRLYDRLSGNVSLEYVLDQFATLGTTRTEAIELLKKLRNAP